MIEFEARGPFERVVDERNVKKIDGHDEIRGSVSVWRQERAHIDVEFTRGHVNLEAYAIGPHRSRMLGSTVAEYVGEKGSDIRLDPDEWDVTLTGNVADWIQQAHRYMTERPADSLIDCLETFEKWDVSRGPFDRAIQNAEERTPLALKPRGEMTDAQWQNLRELLNDIENVHIPESYSE